MPARESTHSLLSPERYLSYLDKEMTIMGILSAFCVLTVGGIANAIKEVHVGTCSDDSIASFAWHNASKNIVAGCLCIMVAALFFYRQRSHLAWCYGQLCLAEGDPEEFGSVESWLAEADGWSSWRDYKAAFAAVGAGFAEFTLVVGASKSYLSQSYIAVALPIIIAAGYIIPMFYVMSVYDSKDRPWAEFFANLNVRKRSAPRRHRNSE